MYSILKPIIYEDLSRDIIELDEDFEASEWEYSEKPGEKFFRGALNTQYISEGLDVYSLYNDNSERVGIVEHLSDNHAEFRTLWFSDNPWSTLFQEEWKQGETINSLLSPEAYEDSIDIDMLLKGHERLVLPEYIYKEFPSIYECQCSLSFSKTKNCQTKKKVSVKDPIFIDESFIIYYPPSNSKVWTKLDLQQNVSFSELGH